MIKQWFAALAVSFLALPATIEAAPEEADLRRHIEILASDDFQGRKPGTIGELLAANYIATQFSEAGLEPGYHGHFYQLISLLERSEYRASASWSHSGERVQWGADDFLAFGRTAEESLHNAPVIFAGYAGAIGEAGSGLERGDVEGAVVLVYNDTPPGDDNAPSFQQRRQQLAELGAAAVIGLVDEDTSWDRTQDIFSRGRTALADTLMPPIEGALSFDASTAFLRATGQAPARLAAAARRASFAALRLPIALDIDVGTAIRPFTGFNVVARLPGGGETGETVAILAHYDHFGICRPEGASDRICNGAIDNASGTAALIETARALAQGERPVRDVLFVATTAEELGLLGARAFANDPSTPLNSIVAALNLDTIAIAPRGAPVGIVGRGYTNLDPIVDAVAGELGRAIDDRTDANAFVQRQDGWALLERGVPTIMAGGSFTDPELLYAFLEGPYHGPDDDIDEPIELGGALEDTLLHIALARALADPVRFPAPQR